MEKHYLHGLVHAVLTSHPEPVSETFSTEFDEEKPEEAALKLAAWLRELAEQLELGARD